MSLAENRYYKEVYKKRKSKPERLSCRCKKAKCFICHPGKVTNETKKKYQITKKLWEQY